MSDILLATLNARYIHAAFGLRYLLANLGELRQRAAIVEFDINQRPLEIVEAIVAREPRGCSGSAFIFGMWRRRRKWSRCSSGCARKCGSFSAGREVSYETEQQEIVRARGSCHRR